jgi:hypothetical protein
MRIKLDFTLILDRVKSAELLKFKNVIFKKMYLEAQSNLFSKSKNYEKKNYNPHEKGIGTGCCR